jgi:hypothetical protein
MFLPRLTLNHNPSYLQLLSSWNYKYESPSPALLFLTLGAYWAFEIYKFIVFNQFGSFPTSGSHNFFSSVCKLVRTLKAVLLCIATLYILPFPSSCFILSDFYCYRIIFSSFILPTYLSSVYFISGIKVFKIRRSIQFFFISLKSIY